MASANRGFCPGTSVNGFILLFVRDRLGVALGFGQLFFIKNGVAHDVLFAGPGPEIEQAAALAAEGKLCMNFGVGGTLADGAAVLHGESLSQNTQWRSGCDAIQSFAGLLGTWAGSDGQPRQNLCNFPDQIVGVCFGDFDTNRITCFGQAAVWQLNVGEEQL